MGSKTGLLLILLFASCAENRESDIQTKIFSEYLRATFKLEIPQERHCFLTVPHAGCQGAIHNMTAALDSAGDFRCPVTVLSSNVMTREYMTRKNWEILEDMDRKLDVLNLNLANVSLIVTEEKKVREITASPGCDSLVVSDFIQKMNACD